MINSLDLGKKVIKDKIPLISRNPGVYRMISSTGEILYIGKAKNIPNRLKSYVSDTNLPIRTERMLSLTHSLETTTTNNESEALLLEANLIKKHKPRFNILLRDDKSFPYIYIGNKDKWPQLTKLRGKKSRTGHYFGPFSSIGSANCGSSLKMPVISRITRSAPASTRPRLSVVRFILSDVSM